jgi:ribosomal protein L11 methyltransferase
MAGGYLEIGVVATGETEEALCDFLFSEGALGLVTEDLPGEPRRISIRGSFAGTLPIGPLVEGLKRLQGSLEDLGFLVADGSIAVREIPLEDWGRNWKKHFKPLLVGRRLIIAPSWEAGAFPQGRLLIRIDPAMAFGTGHHATTRMCLDALEGFMNRWPAGPGPLILDAGTGTGILAIAAAALGARQVVAIDTDPEACEAARRNLALHDCANRVQILPGGIEVVESGPRFDLILANLDTKTLSPLFPRLGKLLAPGGRLIATGITLEDEASLPASIAASGLHALQRRIEDEWLCLTLALETG